MTDENREKSRKGGNVAEPSLACEAITVLA
jgi:hypothetical protein